MMNDTSYPDREKRHWMRPDPLFSPSVDHPIQMVNWIDAVRYCNWLSRLEGLSP